MNILGGIKLTVLGQLLYLAGLISLLVIIFGIYAFVFLRNVILFAVTVPAGVVFAILVGVLAWLAGRKRLMNS